MASGLRGAFTGPPPETPYAGEKFYNWLAHAAGQFGSQRSFFGVIGSVPDVDAALRDYATIFVASRFQAQKVRISYWNPDGSGAAVCGFGLVSTTTATSIWKVRPRFYAS